MCNIADRIFSAYNPAGEEYGATGVTQRRAVPSTPSSIPSRYMRFLSVSFTALRQTDHGCMPDRESVNSPTRRRLLRTTTAGLTAILGPGLFGSATAQESTGDNSNPTVITEPTTITESGAYILENNLEHNVTEEPEQYEYQPFIEIGTSIDGEVIIDGQGHKVTGQGLGAGVLSHTTYDSNVTIQNLSFSNLRRGLYFEISGSLTLEDITVTECTEAIAYFENSRLQAENITIRRNERGVSSSGSEVILSDSAITDNDTVGLYIDRPDISNTTISRNGIGIVTTLEGGIIDGCNIQHNEGNGIESSDSSVTVTDSQISQNGQHGIHVLFSSNWEIRQNTINRNEEYGVYIERSDDTQVTSNTIVANKAGPIFISDSSNGTVTENNRTRGQSPSNRGNPDRDESGNSGRRRETE